MTMDLGDDAFFRSYLKALSSKALQNLWDFQGERLAENPDDEDIIADSLAKKKQIYEERRTRERTG